MTSIYKPLLYRHLTDSESEPLCGRILAAGMDALVGDAEADSWQLCPVCLTLDAVRSHVDSLLSDDESAG